jgi:hypothetical protein
MHEGGYPSWADARRRIQDKTSGAREHLARRPDDPGAPEHENDVSPARAIFGWGILCAAVAGVVAVWLLV